LSGVACLKRTARRYKKATIPRIGTAFSYALPHEEGHVRSIALLCGSMHDSSFIRQRISGDMIDG
jgi:hypothetical protein